MDTALIRSDNTTDVGLPNLFDEDALHELATFVLYSKDISALSLVMIIAILIVVTVLLIMAYFITSHPWFPWHVVQGYKVTVL